MTDLLRTPRRALADAGQRLRPRLRAILQTATAAVAAWYLAVLLLPDQRPSFACIAAVIALGASYGQRGERALQLVGGVVLGIVIGDIIVRAIGTGAPQIGLLVMLAMCVAVIIRGGEVVIGEAAVSAILLVTLAPSASPGFSPNRILEAVIGGVVALAINALFFPPDPSLHVGRAAQALFSELGRTLERVAAALARRDLASAETALGEARGIDRLVGELDAALRLGHETARLAPPRRRTRVVLARYGATLPQLDFAVRDTRVLARHVLRSVRAGTAPAALADAVRELSLSVWELAGTYDRPERAEAARAHAIAAAALADEADGAPASREVVAQVRSTAVDLRRAADLAAGAPEPVHERPTEELLVPAGAG